MTHLKKRVSKFDANGISILVMSHTTRLYRNFVPKTQRTGTIGTKLNITDKALSSNTTRI